MNDFLCLWINVARELNNHMRISKRNYESMFQYQITGVVYSNKSTRPISKISQVILFVLFIVLNNHMSFSNSTSDCLAFILLINFIGVLCLKIWSWAFHSRRSLKILINLIPRLIDRLIGYYEIIVVLTRLLILLQRPDYGTSVFFVSLTRNQSLSIYRKILPNHLLHPFHYCDLEDRCYFLLLLRYQYSLDRLVDVHWI